MNKILLIIEREYMTRVKKKSFIIMSLLGPVLMAALFIVPAWLSTMSDDEELKIAVLDETKEYYKDLEDTETIDFIYLAEGEITELKDSFFTSGYDAVLSIPKKEEIEKNKLNIYSEKQLNLGVLSHITNKLEDRIEENRMKEKGIDKEILTALKSDIDINTISWNEEGEEKENSTQLSMVIGMVLAMIIYMFIFMYGAQVMRGVLEEKTGRVVEIIISSVKPFQLMMGKIVGIALVALTQVALWIVLTSAIVMVANVVMASGDEKVDMTELAQNMGDNAEVEQAIEASGSKMENIMQKVYNLPYGMILFTFLFFFFGGYLLYASLFAAIGGAVDNETDTQQFMLPITIPLILAIVMAQVIIQNPNGDIAFWFSMFPFTSPIIMTIRAVFGVPWWEMALSMFLLIITFIGTTWMAAKIYRTGILLYGKKISYKELWKWLRY